MHVSLTVSVCCHSVKSKTILSRPVKKTTTTKINSLAIISILSCFVLVAGLLWLPSLFDGKLEKQR